MDLQLPKYLIDKLNEQSAEEGHSNQALIKRILKEYYGIE